MSVERLRRACDVLARICEGVVGCLLAAIVAIMIATVWWRYVLNDPLSWGEQVPRMLFVWTTFLGSAVLYRQASHIALDLPAYAPAGVRRVMPYIVETLNVVLLLNLLFYGAKLTWDNAGQQYGALDVSPSVFIVSLPLSAALMLLFSAERAASGRVGATSTPTLTSGM